MSSPDANFQVNLLSGHKKAVNCLDVPHNGASTLATGSDDKTVRLWDTRNNRSSKAIAGFFTSSIGSLAFDAIQDYILYCSSGTSMFTVDLRMEAVLIRSPTHSHIDLTRDDINCMTVHSTGKYIAISDDNYDVTILSTEHPESVTHLQKKHTSIVGAIAFNPGISHELVTGGFDCIVSSCNFETMRTRSTRNFSERSLVKQDASSSQYFNPPFVQGLAYIEDGQGLACALGDGSVIQRFYGELDDRLSLINST